MKEELKKAKIVPVVKLEEYEKAELLAEALRKGGIDCAEITFRASGAERAIACHYIGLSGYDGGSGDRHEQRKRLKKL